MKKIISVVVIAATMLTGCSSTPTEDFSKYVEHMSKNQSYEITGTYKSLDDEISFVGGVTPTGLELAQIDTSEINLIVDNNKAFLKYPKKLTDYIYFDIPDSLIKNISAELIAYKNSAGNSVISKIDKTIQVVLSQEDTLAISEKLLLPKSDDVTYLNFTKNKNDLNIEFKNDYVTINLKLTPTKQYLSKLKVPQESVKYRIGMFEEQKDTMTSAQKSEAELNNFYENKYPNATAFKNTLVANGYQEPKIESTIKFMNVYGLRPSRSTDYSSLYDEVSAIFKDDEISEITMQCVFSSQELEKYGESLIEGPVNDMGDFIGTSYLISKLDLTQMADWEEATDDWLFEYSVKPEVLLDDNAVIIKLVAIKY